jgi:hypothetical protein
MMTANFFFFFCLFLAFSLAQTETNLVICGLGGSHIAYSDDGGASFTAATGDTFPTRCFDVVHSAARNVWIAVGIRGGTQSISRSIDDGQSWTYVTSALTTRGVSVAYSESEDIFMAAGTGTSTLVTSTDGGVSWSAVGAAPDLGEGIFVMYNEEDGLWIVGGTGTVKLATSSDNGASWNIPSVPFTNRVRKVGYGAGRYIAVGQGGTQIAISTDSAMTWTAAATPFVDIGRGIAYNPTNSRWVAGGGDGGNRLVYSADDGASWTVATGHTVVGTTGRKIIYRADDNVFLSGGASLAISDAEGENWSAVPVGGAALTDVFSVALRGVPAGVFPQE